MGLAPGTRIGPYDVGPLIGRGGMGEVYRARDTKLGRDVALKVLPDSFASDPDRVARFKREARTLASLNHPHIAQVHGVEESAGVEALVMELVDGPSLADRIALGPLPVVEVLGIAVQVADALDAAHEQGIVHRDLKPANVKLAGNLTVKVLDFGLAKTISSGEVSEQATALTEGGMVVGTAPYMSPEQVRGSAVDKRSDIWAFGCLLYEMFTRQVPFPGRTTSDTIAGILEREPDWSALPAGVPESVRHLIRRCLTKDIRRRQRDIGDARNVIEEAIATRIDSSAGSVRAQPPRARTAALSLLVVIGAAALAVVALWSLRSAPAPAQVARFSIPLPPGERLSAGNGPFAMSPNGAYVSFVTQHPGAVWLYLRRLSDGQLTIITKESSGYPFFSPDSEWLGFFENGKLKKVPVKGGASIVVADAGASRGAQWADDGSIVLAPTSRAALVRILPGGESRPLTMLDESRGESSHRFPSVIRGAGAVLFRAEGATYRDGSIFARRLDGGPSHPLVPDGGSFPRFAATGHLLYVQDRALMAVGLDVNALSVTAVPAKVLDSVGFFDLSATGSLIYTEATTPDVAELVWVDRQGNPVGLPAQHRNYGHPSLSRDGQRVLVNIQDGPDRHIWIYDIARDALTVLTFERANYWPVWSGDNSRVVYASNRGSTGWDIVSKPADGTGAEEVLRRESAAEVPRTISPDGQWLVYSATQELWLMPLRTKGEPRLLFKDPGNESHPAFSPDSRWLAYVSDESGSDEVYVRPVEDTDAKWRVSVGGGVEPRWHPNSREIFYRTGTRMMAVPISFAPSFTHGKPEPLFDDDYALSTIGTANYDVSPDGRFLMVRGPRRDDAPQSIAIITNWFEELKQLMAR